MVERGHPLDRSALGRVIDMVRADERPSEVLTAEVVKAAHRGGYRVCCYTPNDPVRVSELAGWGVDTIITDAVDQIAPNAYPPSGA